MEDRDLLMNWLSTLLGFATKVFFIGLLLLGLFFFYKKFIAPTVVPFVDTNKEVLNSLHNKDQEVINESVR